MESNTLRSRQVRASPRLQIFVFSSRIRRTGGRVMSKIFDERYACPNCHLYYCINPAECEMAIDDCENYAKWDRHMNQQFFDLVEASNKTKGGGS